MVFSDKSCERLWLLLCVKAHVVCEVLVLHSHLLHWLLHVCSKLVWILLLELLLLEVLLLHHWLLLLHSKAVRVRYKWLSWLVCLEICLSISFAIEWLLLLLIIHILLGIVYVFNNIQRFIYKNWLVEHFKDIFLLLFSFFIISHKVK